MMIGALLLKIFKIKSCFKYHRTPCMVLKGWELSRDYRDVKVLRNFSLVLLKELQGFFKVMLQKNMINNETMSW